MAQPEKDDFNFEDFQLSGVGLTPLADFSEATPLTEPLAAEPVQAVSAETSVVTPVEGVVAVEPEDKKAKKKAKKEKKAKSQAPAKTANVSVARKEKSAFLMRLTSTDPYTVLLGMTVVALLLAVLFLVIEWSRYGFDTKAAKWKQAAVVHETVASPYADFYKNDPSITIG